MDTTPVGRYSPAGDSPYGCADMAGNVSEWTASLWGTDWKRPGFVYPYDARDGREDMQAAEDVLRVVRGGSWLDDQRSVRCAFRGRNGPDRRVRYSGFRVCASPM